MFVGGKRVCKNVLVFLERVFFGCFVGDVDVIGMMVYFIGMMIVGV